MEFLKEFLGEDLYNQVVAKLNGNDKIKLANIADGSYVEKSVYDADIQKAKEEAAAVPEGKSLVDTSEYDALKSDKEKLEKDFKQHKFDSALELKLASSGARNTKALKGLLDMNKIELGEDGLTGFDEQLETIKAENDYLFAAPGASGMPQGNPEPKLDPVEKAFLEKNPGLKID